jgi:DNA-binding protein YbaB
MSMAFDAGPGERRLADYARRVAAIQDQADQTRERLRTLRSRTTSADQSVTVEMAPGGRLERLVLGPEAMRHGPDRLAALITETVRQAHGEVAERMRETLHPLVGDSPAMDFLRDQIDVAQRAQPPLPEEEPAASAAPPRPADSPLRSEAPRPQRPATRDADDDDDDEGFVSVWGDR